MGELILPDGYNSHPISPDKIYAALPVAQASVEKNALNDAYEFVAPDGYAFRVGGTFSITYDSNNFDFFRPPTHSRASMHEAYQAEVAEAEYWDDDVPAFNIDNYPEFFWGQRLRVDVRTRGYTPPSTPDSSSTLNDDEKQRISVSVYGQYDADSEAGLAEHTWQVANDAQVYMPAYFRLPHADIKWWREQAEGSLSDISLTLVPYELPERDLKVITTPEHEKELEVIGQQDISIETWLKSYRADPRSAGISDDELKLHIMNKQRLRGQPVNEDPLRYLKIIQGAVINLDLEVSKLAVEAASKDMNAARARKIEERSAKRRWARNLAHELKTTIQAVPYDKPMDRIVRENASPGWLIRILDEQCGNDHGVNPDAPIILKVT